MRFDDLLDEIGDFGKFQHIQYGLASASIVLSAMFSLNMVFIGFTPEHTCNPSQDLTTAWDNFSSNLQAINASSMAFLSNLSLTDFYIPATYDNGKVLYDQCTSYNYSANSLIDTVNKLIFVAEFGGLNQPDNSSLVSNFDGRRSLSALVKTSVSITSCKHGWRYSNQYFSSSVVTKWNLVCSDRWLVSFVKMIFFAGRLVGSYAFGMLGDRFGRRIILLSNFAVLVCCSIGCAFAPHLITFSAIYFIQGAMQAGLSATAYVYVCELVGPSKRLLLGVVAQVFYPVGYLLLTAIAYAVVDYFWLQITLAVPAAVLFLLYLFLAAESPRWLVTRGRKREAVEILWRTVQVNGSDVTKERLEQLVVQVMENINRRSSGTVTTFKPTDEKVVGDINPRGSISVIRSSQRSLARQRGLVSVSRISIAASIHDLPKLSLADDDDGVDDPEPEVRRELNKIKSENDTESKSRSSFRGSSRMDLSGEPVQSAAPVFVDVAAAEECCELETSRKRRTYSVIDLLREWFIAKVTLAMWFCMFIGANGYYGLSLVADQLDGNPYVNFGLTAAMEIPACFAAGLMAKKVGRIRTVMFTCVLGALSCLATSQVTDSLVRLVVALGGKLLVTTAYTLISLVASEIFPTVVRNLGYGAAGVCARVGGMLAPLMLNLPVEYAFLLFTASLFACSIACWLLPDYGKRQLPETLDDLRPQRSAEQETSGNDSSSNRNGSRMLRFIKRSWRTCAKVCCGCVDEWHEVSA